VPAELADQRSHPSLTDVRTIKEEEVDLSVYIDYNDAYRQLGRFLDEMYMYKRIHLYNRYARIGIRSEGFGAFP
jgi:hypothetical protein